MYAAQPPQAPATDQGVGGKPPYPPLGPSSSSVTARAEPIRGVPPAAGPAPTPMPQQGATVGLPVTEEQATLERTFARNIAEQASNTIGSAAQPPVSRSAAGAPGGNAISELPGLVNGTPAVIIKFGHGITRLSDAAKQQLNDFAAQARRHPGLVRVVGHSSRRTGNMDHGAHLASNFNVSVDRANAVAGELVGLGIDPARLKIEAVGASMPRYHETMPSGEAENRRVEIYLE